MNLPKKKNAIKLLHFSYISCTILLEDINKRTVGLVPNFDDEHEEPSVLPANFPFLLCNGTTGIAVGMATNMPSHNLREVASAICAYIDDPEISIDKLMHHIKGPDFPTGGIIYGTAGIKKAYTTGRGKVTIRSKFTIETDKSGRESIVFTEGKMIEGTWWRDGSYSAPAKYLDENGDRVYMNQGKTWVCIIWTDYEEDVVIE